ncbi:hypothetical protein BCR34DRAFT_486633 [Clohesyomyces aquaticus]|uniref:Six-hairpin glycosidase-like protein n=1 Tax=Clohesyomyces aquaticus TaxID=1231657 RepID=A0A1Y1ZJ07_9PLEO|nr:hypothetical protein BCR34DRAFT_486633 [Clohesyomyces aquaticus]
MIDENASELDKIVQVAKELAKHSWEYGAVSQALVEVYNPEISLFADTIDFKTHRESGVFKEAKGLVYAKQFIRLDQQTLVDGEGSAGDPASLGIAALLLSQSDSSYQAPIERQVDALLKSTPKYENGAISHRENVAELWSDFTYMALPFLAFRALLQDDVTSMHAVMKQCNLQRQVLQEPTSRLWQHIIGPEKEDRGLWSTGNGWAAAGLTRVLAVAKAFHHKAFADASLDIEVRALEGAISDIIKGAVASADRTSGVLRNYLGDDSWFGEMAGTVAIASVIFRMAVVALSRVSPDQLEWALKIRQMVLDKVRCDGRVSPVVNPMNWHDRVPKSASSECQAFTLHMIAAHRDWKDETLRLKVV